MMRKKTAAIQWLGQSFIQFYTSLFKGHLVNFQNFEYSVHPAGIYEIADISLKLWIFHGFYFCNQFTGILKS